MLVTFWKRFWGWAEDNEAKILKLKLSWGLEAEVWSRFWSSTWVKFSRDFVAEVWWRFCGCRFVLTFWAKSLIKIWKLKFGRDSEAELWHETLGSVCLWKCFSNENGGSGLSRVFRVLLKSPPISSVMNNFLSHHYATLVALNFKLLLQFEFCVSAFCNLYFLAIKRVSSCLTTMPLWLLKVTTLHLVPCLGSTRKWGRVEGWVLLKFLKQNHSAFVAISAHCHVHSIFAKTFCKIFVKVCSSSCLHVDSMFTGCLMWEVSAPRERSGFTVLRESPPSFSASLFPAMISSLQRMRRWTGNTSEAINSCEEGSPKKGVNNINKAKTHTSMPPGVWQPVWYIKSSLSALYAICSHRSWRASQEI